MHRFYAEGIRRAFIFFTHVEVTEYLLPYAFHTVKIQELACGSKEDYLFKIIPGRGGVYLQQQAENSN